MNKKGCYNLRVFIGSLNIGDTFKLSRPCTNNNTIYKVMEVIPYIRGTIIACVPICGHTDLDNYKYFDSLKYCYI